MLEANGLAFTCCYDFTIQRQLKIQSNELELFHTGRIYEASPFLKAFFLPDDMLSYTRRSPYNQNQPCVLLPNNWLQIRSNIMHFKGTMKIEMQRPTKWTVRHRNVLFLLRPLSFPTLETVFPLCFLLDNGQLAGPQINNWGPSTLGQLLTLPSLISSKKQKCLDQQGCGPPCLRNIMHIFIFQIRFYLSGTLNSEASTFIGDRHWESKSRIVQ